MFNHEQCLIVGCTNKIKGVDLKSTIADVINSENIFVIDNEINENNSHLI